MFAQSADPGFAELTKLLASATEALNALVKSEHLRIIQRKIQLDRLAGGPGIGPEAYKELRAEIEKEAQRILDIHQMLARFQESRKNAEVTLDSMLAQAKKDLETVSKTAGASQQSTEKLKQLQRELGQAGAAAIDKLGFPILDLGNWEHKIAEFGQAFDPSLVKHTADSIRRRLQNLERCLKTARHNLEELAGLQASE